MSGERQYERLAEVLSTVGAAERLEEALRALVFGAIELVRGETGAIRAYDVAGTGRHVAYWARPDGSLAPDVHPDPPPGSVAAELKAGGEARLIEDLWELAPEASAEERARRWQGARSSIAVPISARGERIGSLHIDHSNAGHFTAADLSVATALAALAGAVIERARQAARHETREAASVRQAHLYASAAALTAQVTAENVARTVAEHARSGLGAAEASVVALDPEGRWFEVLHHAGYQEGAERAPEVMREWRRFPASTHTPAADAARSRRPVILEHADARQVRYPHLAAVRSATGEGAVAVLPLVVEQRVLGVLHVGFVGERHFGAEELAALETFSHLAAQALERARLYEDARDQATVHVQLNAALREAAAERERAVAALEEERRRLKDVFLRAPAALCVLRGQDHVVAIANVAFFGILGLRDVTGRPFKEALQPYPEREGGRILEVLDGVYASGVAYKGRGVRLPIVKGSKRFDVICEPTRDVEGAVDGIYVVATEAQGALS